MTRYDGKGRGVSKTVNFASSNGLMSNRNGKFGVK